MKIVVTGLRGFPNIQGGIETHCEELYPRLVRLGCDVTLTRRKPFVKETPPLNTYKGVKFKDLNTFGKSGIEATVHTLKSTGYAFRTKADVIHIHAIGPSIAIPFAKLLGLKVVVTHHGTDYNRQKWGRFARFVLKTGEYFAAKWADEIIVISTLIRQVLKDKYKRTRNVHLIYNGVNKPVRIESTDYIRNLGLTPQKYILAVGRFVEEKNFDKLILAYTQLTNKSYQLVIVGDADHPTSYSEALKKLADEHQIIHPGMLKGEPLQELYTHAGLFVLPSSHEGLPISLLEAMSYGMDVLISDIPANKAVNLPPDCYFHYDEDMVPTLHKAMETKIQENILHPYDLTPYEWDSIAEQTMEVYRKIVAKPIE